MKFYFSFLFVGIFITGFAQKADSYLVLKNNETIVGKTVEYKNPLFGKKYFIVNGKNYGIEQVKNFKVFGIPYIVEPIRGNGRLIPARMVIDGKMQLLDFTRPPRNEARANIIPEKQVISMAFLKKDGGSLKVFRHGRFMRAIKDNPAALQAFKPARAVKTTSDVIGWTSVGVMLGSLFFISNDFNSGNTAYSIFIAGAVINLIGDFYILFSRNKYLDGLYGAVYAYNK
jgi:hypothetical protein